jgi:hypothetical protein
VRLAANTNFIVFDLTWHGLEQMTFWMRGTHANHYPIDATTTDCMPRLYDSFDKLDILIYYLNSQMITNWSCVVWPGEHFESWSYLSCVFVFIVSRCWRLLCMTRWTLLIMKLFIMCFCFQCVKMLTVIV